MPHNYEPGLPGDLAPEVPIMTTIHAILDNLARRGTDARDKGDKFERLMAAYLRTVPLQKPVQHGKNTAFHRAYARIMA